jgi:DNA-binding MarR family transcriptional regulator
MRGVTPGHGNGRSRKDAPGEAPTALGGVLEFMRVVWALDHGLQTTSKQMRSRVGVTGPQRLVIRIVGRVPGVSAGRLASILHVDPSTLSVVLKTLEARGLVKRRTDTGDRRRALLELTASGRAVDRLRAGTAEEAARRVLARFSAREVEGARTLLAALAAELSER